MPDSLELQTMDHSILELAPIDKDDTTKILGKLADDYREIGDKVGVLQVEVSKIGVRVNLLMEQLSILEGKTLGAKSVVGAGLQTTAETPRPLSGEAAQQAIDAVSLDMVTFESARDYPHTISDEFILRRKSLVLGLVGETKATDRLENGVYASLVQTHVDHSDIEYMKTPGSDKEFDDRLLSLRQRWKKSFKDVDGYEHSNLRAQSGGDFLHFHTDARMSRRIKGDPIEIDSRIYLNPRMRDSLNIFEQILSKANKDGLVMSGKINVRQPSLYPRFYRSRKHRYDNGESDVGSLVIRTDNIVFYSTVDSRGRLLEIVKEVYAANTLSFEGRLCPEAPLRIADGLAIGEEPKYSNGNESLSGIVAKSLCSAMEEADARTWVLSGGSVKDIPDSVWVRETRKSFFDTARVYGIDPANIAFRAK